MRGRSARSPPASLLLAAFVAFELRAATPLIQLRIFAERAFAVDNVVLLLMSAVFVPFFFFASVYAQASLGYSATEAGLFLLVFFGGFAAAAQWGGRIVDKRGARPAIVLGCLLVRDRLLPVGQRAHGPRLRLAVVLHRAGRRGARPRARPGQHGRAQPRARHGLRRGHRHHADRRNLGASLGLAVMGSLFIAGHGHFAEARPLDVADSTQTVVWVMAGIMAASFLVAVLGLPKGRVEAAAEDVVEIEEPAAAEHARR